VPVLLTCMNFMISFDIHTSAMECEEVNSLGKYTTFLGLIRYTWQFYPQELKRTRQIVHENDVGFFFVEGLGSLSSYR